MKTVIFNDFGRQFKTEIRDSNRPTPAPGETLVRVHAAAMNRLSKLILEADVPSAEGLTILGNEGTGIVESGGKFAPGTPVIIYGGRELGVSTDGIFQEWVTVRDSHLFKLPDNITLSQGAALPVSAVTAYQAITSVSGLASGDRVLITGAGGAVGFALMQIARAFGFRPIGIVSSAAKAQALNERGFDDVICGDGKGLTEALSDILNDKSGVSAIFDPVGGPASGGLVPLLNHGGELVIIGFVAGQSTGVGLADLVVAERHIRGYSLHAESDEAVQKVFPEIAALVESGQLIPVIDSEYAPEEIEAGYRRLDDRTLFGSVLLRFNTGTDEA
ncbi:zinc-binding alcohol dehydrogenase family protein [Paenarthrobacter nicotinovorans]|uniref:quinone oxidoreductase family protein n=1 Tax=Paenarthrobacter nicotinovorans TaxID=29320 RepID=UPI003811E3A6